MSKLTKALTAAAGNAGGEALYVEDVFSTYLYTGNNTGTNTQNIVNGIDLAGEGGAVWIKTRNVAWNHGIWDTETDGGNLYTNTTDAQQSNDDLASFNSDGFGVSSAVGTGFYNFNDQPQVSWTFRKAEKFFDVVTYTGNGSVQSVNHNLDSVPACMIVKRTDSTGTWYVYHVDLGAGINGRKTLKLNSTAAQSDSGGFSDHPTDTAFTVNYAANTSGATYVAYLFASDAGGFGDDGSENIIKCGSWDATGNNEVNLGFEPQWILIKNADGGNNWGMFDSMRGWTANGNIKTLPPNLSSAESSESGVMKVTSTGFTWIPAVSGNTYIYIAIRRPMKTPESGTEVFNPIAATSTNPTTDWAVGFPAGMFFEGFRTFAGVGQRINTRLTGGSAWLETWRTNSEFDGFGGAWDEQDSYSNATGGVTPLVGWFFKRATGFFDVVAYTGDGTASRQITHNLGSAPEMIIVKCRSASNTYWETWHSSLPDDGSWASNVALNSTDGYGGFQRFDGAATQTAAYWTTGNNGEPNTSGQTYISYLFATLAGVSKVGSYTGTGSNVDVDCGFSAGARFILIKRTDSTGDWYVWDSVRGIVAGNDPYLLLNSTAAEVTSTDYIDPLASGFTVTSSAPAALNASGGTYIFLAIA